MAEITEAVLDITGAEIHFNREELEMLHNVLHRVQLSTTGYGKAASDVLGVLSQLFGSMDNVDHEVEMHTRHGHSLYWGSAEKSACPF